jgi:hypothetical protein
MSYTDKHANRISPRVRDMLRSCQDYSENSEKCEVYGSCRCLGNCESRDAEDLIIKWIGNCMKLQAAKRRGESLLEEKT